MSERDDGTVALKFIHDGVRAIVKPATSNAGRWCEKNEIALRQFLTAESSSEHVTRDNVVFVAKRLKAALRSRWVDAEFEIRVYVKRRAAPRCDGCVRFVLAKGRLHERDAHQGLPCTAHDTHEYLDRIATI